MSATWICLCGHNFTDYGAVSGDVICCPKCGVVLGEALPTQFESPTTFQAEPHERVILASPEVALQAIEPLARPSQTREIDEFAEPDIRVKVHGGWTKWWPVFVFVTIVVIAFLAGGIIVVQTDGCGPLDTAQIQTKALAQACDVYREMHGEFPETLGTLLNRDEFGIVYLDDPAKLVDPWGRPYQYDPKGGRNDGRHADIWTFAPEGKIIGNWPKQLH